MKRDGGTASALRRFFPILEWAPEYTGQTLVGDLVASGFVTDAASGAFNDSYTQFTTGATQMVGGIQGLSDFLNAAADALGNTDSELANAIRS